MGLASTFSFHYLKSWIDEWLFCFVLHPHLHVLSHLLCCVVRPPDGGDDQLIQCAPHRSQHPHFASFLLGEDHCSDLQGCNQPYHASDKDYQDEQHGQGAEQPVQWDEGPAHVVQHHVFCSISQREAPFCSTSGLVGSLRLVSQKSISCSSCILKGAEFFHLQLHGGLVYP